MQCMDAFSRERRQAMSSPGIDRVVSLGRDMAPDRDFETIILDARKGDEAALTELYRALYPRVLRYLRAVEPTEAEDLACDAWARWIPGVDVVGDGRTPVSLMR
jgi:hypothetical protein